MLLDEEIKEVWLQNIPAALFDLEQQRRLIDPATGAGVRNRVMLKTGNANIADEAERSFLQQQALDAAVAAQNKS